MKYKYFETPCLGGCHGITIMLQFQKNKIVTFKALLLLIVSVVLFGLWGPSSYTNVLKLSLTDYATDGMLGC